MRTMGLAILLVACGVLVFSTEGALATQEYAVKHQEPQLTDAITTVNESLDDVGSDSVAPKQAQVSEKEALAIKGGAKVAKARKQFDATSTEYAKYMDHLDAMYKKEQSDLTDTSLVKGNKPTPESGFASYAQYKTHMQKLLKTGYKQLKGSIAHYEKDTTVDLDEPMGLGESDKESPPGHELIASPEVPAVYLASQGRPAKQSSVEFGAAASRAVDGRTDGIFTHGSCTHTKVDENPWWRTDLGKTMNIQHLEVYNRADCCGERLSSFEVRVGDAKDWQKNPKCGDKWSVKQGEMVKIPCNTLQGQYVFVVVRAQMALNLCEVKVYASDNPGANAARGMPSSQSSTLRGGSSDRAVDGHTNTDYKDNSCTHTEYELKPWWNVDLGKQSTVAAVQIWNRGDCCGTRLNDFEVRVGDNPQMWASSKRCGGRWSIGEGEHKEISCGGQDGRFVWVVLQKRAVLTLCEVRVLTTYAKKGQNIARGKPSEQSSTGYGGIAARAVDGNVETNYKGGSCTHTHYDQEPWWRVDLGTPQAIGAVQVWNRGDCCGSRLSNFEVRVGDGEKWQGTTVCGGERQKVAQGKRGTILCGGTEGRFVYIVKRNQGYLNLCEVRVLPWKGPQEEVSGGCESKALGVETRSIKPGDMAASSFYGNEDEFGPNNARLNYRGSAWQPLNERVGEWLQVTLPKVYTLSAVATQGDFEADKWVTGYKVRYFNTASRWRYVGGGDGEVLTGNVDRNTLKKNTFTQPIKTAKVRFYPTEWKGAMALRVEVYGRTCEKESEKSKVEALPATGAAPVAGAPAGYPAQQPCPAASKAQCDGRRRRSIKLVAEDGYGEGAAKLWYAATKGGDDRQNIAAHSVYVSEGVDFRTEDGSIYAGKDLVAGRSLMIKAWPGFGHGSAQLWYAQRSRKAFHANTLYLRSGDLRTQEGSVFAAERVRAGKFIEIGAYPGFGEKSAQLWYSATGKTTDSTKFEPETVYLKQASFATQTGSITSAKDVKASRYLSMKAFPNYGTGQANFWYVGSGKAPYKSNSVYLEVGNFATERGSIISKYDVEVGRHLVINAYEGYGNGQTKLWYAADSRNGYGPDALYVASGDQKTEEGSIVAAKSLVAGRTVEINAYPGLGSGKATLMFANTKGDKVEPNSLYLQAGDFRTQEGSIVAAQDLGAGRSVKIKSKPGTGDGEAELFYSHSSTGKFDAETLYLKSGDFTTEKGNIHAGDSLVSSRYLEVKAFPGFGEGSAKLWHCNKEIEGYAPNSLYLKSGDFRTQDGSIHASKDVVAQRYITIQAMEGFGSGSTKLWYSATGKDKYRSNSLYLTHGDFHTESGSIYAGNSLHAAKYLKIAASPGHGTGFAKLWYSKSGTAGFGDDTLYLEDGHLQVQKGSLIAAKDVQAGRFIKVGAKEGYGTGSTQLWYSGSGKEGTASHTLYLDSGDFRTQDGDIRSAKDVVAKEGLYGANLDVNYAYVPGQITAGHLFLGGDIKPPPSDNEMMEESMELIDIKSGMGAARQDSRRDVASLLTDLSTSNDKLVSRNSELRSELDHMLSRLSALEELADRR